VCGRGKEDAVARDVKDIERDRDTHTNKLRTREIQGVFCG